MERLVHHRVAHAGQKVLILGSLLSTRREDDPPEEVRPVVGNPGEQAWTVEFGQFKLREYDVHG